MRIISGIAKGRKIISPEGMNTRPTLDRIKEAMFNIIQGYTFDAISIDLYSGTGSLGLEAISRYGKHSYLVEKDANTYEFLKKNSESLGFDDKCTCINKPAEEVLKDMNKKNQKFDIIFIDPPYLKEMIPPHIEYISCNNMLKKNGIIITKIDVKEEIYQGFGNITKIDERKYGNTIIVFYKIESLV